MAADPDAELMLAFQRGDARAFRALFDRYARAMVAYCHHFVKDAARAEELAQDVFLKLYRHKEKYEPSARFKTFLYRVASNHCLNELRRGEHAARRVEREPGDEGEPLDRLASPNASPEETSAAAQLGRAVQALLDALPDKQRAAFVLCRFQGLGYEEIAQVLDTSVSAVKSLIHRATVAAADALERFES